MAEQKIDMNAVMASPEVQRAIQESAAKAAAAAVAELAKGGSAQAFTQDDATRRLFSDMALAIAEMGNQGSGRVRPVAPEVMAQRLAASKELRGLLDEVAENLREAKHESDKKRVEKWTPRYRVVAKVYFNETFVEPYLKPERRGDKPRANIIAWSGPPNDALEPLNDIAKRLKQLFKESVGTAPKLKPMSGPNGGQVALDTRRYWMTIEGHVVQGSAPAKGTVLGEDDPPEISAEDSPPEFLHILGTIHPPTPQKPGDIATLAGQR